MKYPAEIWLAPECHEEGDGIQWCQDDVWGDCGECGKSSVKYVLATDYERLEQECERLRAVLDGAQYPNLDQLSWLTVEVCRTIGTTVAEMTIKLQAERDTALQLLAQCQEHLHPHRDAVLWGKVVGALRGKP